MIIALITIIIFGLIVLYIAATTKTNDTEIIVGQRRDIKELGERIQNVLDSEKIEKKQERKLHSVATEASKLFKKQRLRQSEKKYLSIIKQDHKNIKAYQGLGLIYLEQKEYEGAREAFERICELDPTHDSAFNNLGLSLFNIGKYEEAIKAYEHSVSLNNKVVHRFLNLALASQKMADYKKEVSALEHAVDLEPKNIEYIEELAEAATRAGDNKLAKKTLQKIIEIDPTRLEAQRNLARLKK
jgi:tetratricopeptide (TPR) repeat protein